jgi:predicted nucleotide-binding protein (sugar kinase/HSP70/actin superfamily)
MEVVQWVTASGAHATNLEVEDFLEYETEEEVRKAIIDNIEEPVMPYMPDFELFVDNTEINEESVDEFVEEWKRLKYGNSSVF